jgi:diguanylate cyclase (GGDEF)-like protein
MMRGLGRGRIPVSDAVYRDLVSTLFTMRLPIAGFGALYGIVGALIYLKWPDSVIAGLTVAAVAVTAGRIVLINRYHQAGGASQEVAALRRWELAYELLTYLFAILLAALNVRGLTAHAPLIHLATISLVFTFGAGVVSRTSSRLRLCMVSVTLAVLPTVTAMLVHAASDHAERLHSEFFLLEAFLLIAVGLMSLQSAAHLYASAVEHLSTKQDMAKLAKYDPLTSLPNRLLVREAFQELFSFSRRSQSQLALHYLDLDGFKAINDRYGHPVGDKLLVEVAQRLLSTVRASDFACRLGGDEFLIIQSDVRHRDQAELLGRRIIRQISEDYDIEGATMRVTASIGVAMVPECGIELDRLIECADAALYQSKSRGKAQVLFCSPDVEVLTGRAVA